MTAVRRFLRPSRLDSDLAGIPAREAVNEALNHPRSRARSNQR